MALTGSRHVAKVIANSLGVEDAVVMHLPCSDDVMPTFWYPFEHQARGVLQRTAFMPRTLWFMVRKSDQHGLQLPTMWLLDVHSNGG
jgi:hypothetical protein